MICIPDAICYTECPETWGDVFKQRIRWQKAFVDSVIKYHQLLLAHCFRRSFAFFVIMDAIIAGTFSTYFTMVAILTALLWPGANQAWLLTYVVLSTITTFVYNILAIHQSKKGTAYTLAECKQFLSVILLDLVFWRYMNFLFIILGTILYFFNQSDWNKVARSNHEYSV
jgi:cellulose synthase/poly-beta-1,6-N-acetylglucosamine synthase-like glycosyltransferase